MDGCSSNGSGENTWLDLSKSDYAKVIFEGLYWDSDSNEVGCYFNVTESVNKSPSDYLGLFKVGYDDISQCLASKKLCQLDSDEQSKTMYCKFILNELPDLDGYYQFVYITQDKEVCGASMPIFLLHRSKVDSSDEEVTTEKVEDGFLMVRHGLEQKYSMLTTKMNKSLTEKSMLAAKCEKLEQENDTLRTKIENEQIANNNIVKELKAVHQETTNQLLKVQQDLERKLEEFQKENCNLKDTIVAIKIKKDVALSKVQNLQKECDSISLKLEVAEKQRDECLIKLESLEKENKSTCLKIKSLLDEKDEITDKLKSANISLDVSFKKIKAYQIEKAAMIQRLELMKGLCGLSHDTITDDKYKKILESDSEFNGILEALEERKHLVEQLEDAKCMIQALEDSKCLAMAEMKDLSETLVKQKAEMQTSKAVLEKKNGKLRNQEEEILRKNLLLDKKDQELKKQIKEIESKNLLLEKKDKELKKAMEDFHKMKCENVALRIYLDEEDRGKKSKEIHIMEKSLKESKASLDMQSALKKKSEQILEMEKNLQQLKARLDEETAFKGDLIEKLKTFNPNCKEDSLNEVVKNLLSKVELMKLELQTKSMEFDLEEKFRQELKAALEVETVFKKDLIEKLKRLNPNVKEECLDKDIENLLSKAESIEIELKRISEDSENKDSIIQGLKKDLHDSTRRVMIANAKSNAIIEEIEKLKLEMEKLGKEAERKDIFIEQLNKEMKVLEDKRVAALDDATEKTIRLFEAAELYKKQYIKIEKLQKKLKGSHSCASEVSSGSSQNAIRCKSAQSNSVTNDAKKSAANNSDSDTGEHVRSLTCHPEKKEFSEKLKEVILKINRNIGESEVEETKQLSAACSSKSAEIRQELNASSSQRKMSLQDLYKAKSVEETFDVPCCYCKKSFIISAKSCLPLFEHYEIEHKMYICPVCAELFDKVIPPKYFMLHVNDHFKSN